jgi:hypothetical protein
MAYDKSKGQLKDKGIIYNMTAETPDVLQDKDANSNEMIKEAMGLIASKMGIIEAYATFTPILDKEKQTVYLVNTEMIEEIEESNSLSDYLNLHEGAINKTPLKTKSGLDVIVLSSFEEKIPGVGLIKNIPGKRTCVTISQLPHESRTQVYHTLYGSNRLKEETDE